MSADITVLRLVPGSSPVHRLWAGTKLLVAAILAVVLSVAPTWPAIGCSAVVVGVGLVAGRIPLGAFPRLPRWFLLFVLGGAVLNLLAGVDPQVEFLGISLGVGGIEQWARFMALAIVLLTSGALVGWTTPLGEVAPAVGSLAAPLRRLGVPVTEWVTALALALRSLPLLADELRVLAAALRLRLRDENGAPVSRFSVGLVLGQIHDLLASAVVATIRRGRDVADAITARGGLGGAVAAWTDGPGVVDAVVLVAVVAVAAAAILVS